MSDRSQQVPALCEKATHAPCPLFKAIFILIASVLLTLLWIYYGNGGDEGVEAVVTDALPASLLQPVIYRGMR